MIRPSFRVRTMIFAVLAVAIVMAIVANESKRQRLLYLNAMVVKYAQSEAYWIDQEKAMNRFEAKWLAKGELWGAATSASQALYNRDQARYFGTLLRKYEGALRQPSVPLDSDPPAPGLSPSQYLTQVPYYSPGIIPGNRPAE